MTIMQLARQIAREFRKNPTQAEKVLRSKLRNRKFMNLKFLFQHPIFYRYENKKRFFVADFYCHELRLVVEVDGEVHSRQKEYDQIRTDILENKNIAVIRLSNDEVISNINNVLINLKRKMEKI